MITLSARFFRTSLALALFVFVDMGCKENPPTPVPPSTGAKLSTASNDNDDVQAVNEFLKKDQPASPSSNALPPNHPPIGASDTVKPGAAASPLPPGHPPLSKQEGSPTDAITYQAPTEWQPQPVTSSMRKAQFLIPRASDDHDDGQMVVYYFGAGQGGTVESNIDRWIGMFSTADGKPVPPAAIKRESQEVDGMKVTLLDVTGVYVDPMAGKPAGATKGEQRMLSAIVETPQGPWFFKGVGPITTMKTQEPGFEKFVASIRKNP